MGAIVPWPHPATLLGATFLHTNTRWRIDFFNKVFSAKYWQIYIDLHSKNDSSFSVITQSCYVGSVDRSAIFVSQFKFYFLVLILIYQFNFDTK